MSDSNICLSIDNLKGTQNNPGAYREVLSMTIVFHFKDYISQSTRMKGNLEHYCPYFNYLLKNNLSFYTS